MRANSAFGLSFGSDRAEYAAAIRDHDRKVAAELRKLHELIARGATDGAASDALARLDTMRVLLRSGLFDPEFYRAKYPDVGRTGLPPVEHYVLRGEAELRMPNPAFLPSYYRRKHMPGRRAGENALRHYIEFGEQSGGKPNAGFDPRAYLAPNPGLSSFVDRPLFHYLAIGRREGQTLPGTPPVAMMSHLEEIEHALASGNEPYRAKPAVVEWLGIAEGFAFYKTLLDRPEHVELHRKPMADLRETAERRDGAFCLTAPSRPFVVPPPRVIGDGGVGPLAGATRSVYVACLVDARVRAGSDVIEVDDVALIDFDVPGLQNYFDKSLYYDPAIFHASRGTVWLITPEGASAEVEVEEAFTLLGIHTRLFGHWMLEYLPKYVAAILSGSLPPVPLLIDAGLPKTHRQALALLFPEVRLIEVPTFRTARVRRLWCGPILWSDEACPPTVYGRVIREMARRAEGASMHPTGAERIFLARERSWHDLVNQEALIAAAQSRGFLVVYPNRLDFAEQVNLVRNARFVVGPSGGSMYLAFFAQPGTRLCMFRYAQDVAAAQRDMTGLFGEIGLDVTVLTGPLAQLNTEFPSDSDYQIDVAAFGRFLDEWLDS